MIIIGLDPGLARTGWGVILQDGARLAHIANGEIHSKDTSELAERLYRLDSELADILSTHRPDNAAVEEIFANRNPRSTIKLAQARGVALLACARMGLAVQEYSPRLIKKSLVGTGAASKEQVQAMLAVLLPGVVIAGADAADALAVAIAYAHHMPYRRAVSSAKSALNAGDDKRRRDSVRGRAVKRS